MITSIILTKTIECTEFDKYPFYSRHLLSSGTSSEDTFMRIRDWIDDCKSTHQKCQASDDSQPYMPKRILNLRANRVVLQEDVYPSTYACLSHCWGQRQDPIKTLSNTINDFKSEIPWEKLSKTFQDAVDICRRLNIDYLWIDSLCILQDNKEDWEEESVKMADIYEHAFITVAATKSTDGSGGCYNDRDPKYISCGTVIEGSVYVRKEMPPMIHTSDIEEWPLLDRGWVFQEMYLSKRVLHFGHQEVIWQCLSCSESESDNQFYSTHARMGFLDGLLDRWQNLINHYSGLTLSRENDKLAALAAISQRAAQTRSAEDRFLAGLWQNTLLQDLTWEAYHDFHRDDPPEKRIECIVPSWSWASVKTRVWWPVLRQGYQPLKCTQLVTIDMKPIGSPYLGQFKSQSDARLIFRGPVIHTTAGELERSTYPVDSRCLLNKVMAVRGSVPDYGTRGSIYGPADSQLIILPLRVSDDWSCGGDALVLRPRGDRDTYERVGLAELEYVKDVHLKTSELYEGIESYLSTLPTFEIIIT